MVMKIARSSLRRRKWSIVAVLQRMLQSQILEFLWIVRSRSMFRPEFLVLIAGFLLQSGRVLLLLGGSQLPRCEQVCPCSLTLKLICDLMLTLCSSYRVGSWTSVCTNMQGSSVAQSSANSLISLSHLSFGCSEVFTQNFKCQTLRSPQKASACNTLEPLSCSSQFRMNPKSASSL